MKSAKFYPIFLPFYFAIPFHAWGQIQPVEILEPPMPNLERIQGGEGEPEILWLRCDEDYLKINFISTSRTGGDSQVRYILYLIDWSVLLNYDMNKMSYSEPVIRYSDQYKIFDYKYWHAQQCTGLIHDASSVTVNGQRIFLENSYAHIEYDDYDTYTNEFITEACITPNEKYIIGITHVSNVSNFHYFYDLEKLHVWDSSTGKEYSDLTHEITVGYHELYYSPKENYLMARYFVGEHIDLGGERSPFGYPLKYVLAPQSFLIDLSHPRELISKRDVAFTSDDEYFVTERDGVPTLVHARTDTNILRYAMESPMISAAFSPDNQRLYLAGANSQIYVFDSHLPSRAPGWEVYP